MRTKQLFLSFLALIIVLAIGTALQPASAAQEKGAEEVPRSSLVLLFDTSSLMWDKSKGPSRIDVMRHAVQTALPLVPYNVDLRIAAYGRDKRHPCYDMDFLSAFGSSTEPDVIKEALASLPHRKKHPIELALEPAVFAAESNHGGNNRNTVAILSGGAEVCGSDPCALAERLARSNPRLRFEVIGYNVAASHGYPLAQLQCIAERGGGTYAAVSSPESFMKAFKHVIKQAAAPAPQAPAEPAYQEALRDGFDTNDLAAHWQVMNSNDEAYSLADGVLKLEADNQSGERGTAVKNVFHLKEPLSAKQARLSAHVSMIPATTHEEISVGLTDGHAHYISASLVPVGYAPTTFSLAITETTGDTERYQCSTIYRDILLGWGGIVNFAKEKMPFVLQLIKDGDSYRARAVSAVDPRYTFETEPMVIEGFKGRPFINLHQREKDIHHRERKGEKTEAQIDWFTVETVK